MNFSNQTIEKYFREEIFWRALRDENGKNDISGTSLRLGSPMPAAEAKKLRENFRAVLILMKRI